MKHRMIVRPLMNPKRITATVIGALATAAGLEYDPVPATTKQ
jgi:hypothetical protein